MIAIGIDPGVTGAIAMITHRGLVNMADMPTMPRGAGTGFVKRQVNAAELARILREWLADADKNEVMVALEAVNAFPGQGVATTFSLALTAGLIEGAVSARGYPHELVPPNVWKKALGLSSSKDQARMKAQRLYPEADIHRVKDHNRAEAILIARYCYEKHA